MRTDGRLPVTFDTSGWRAVVPDTWRNNEGDLLALYLFEVRPDLPAPLEDLVRLRRGLAEAAAHAGGGLVQADVVMLDRMPAIRKVVKMPAPQHRGMLYVGSYLVPRAECSAVLKVQCAENGTTGLRDSIVGMRYLRGDGDLDTWAAHPYAPETVGGTPRNGADDECYDAEFPMHPLSRVRRILSELAPGVRVDEDYRRLPPFTVSPCP